MKRITSAQNLLVKEVRALRNRKGRDEKNLFFVEGVKLFEEAIKEGAEIVRVFLSEQFAFQGKNGSILAKVGNMEEKAYVLPDRLFLEISDTVTPQGIMAVVEKKRHELDRLMAGDKLFLVLDSVQDPGNIGTIVRTADAAGFSAVVLLKGCADIYSPKAIRSTMGSIFRVPVIYAQDEKTLLKTFKSYGVRLYAAHIQGEKDYFQTDLKRNIAVVVGNESKGINDSIIRFADALIRIPMIGRPDSLNVSIAAALFMYESVRQRVIV